MIKQWPSRNPLPESHKVQGMKEYQIRYLENVPASDPSIGRRTSGGDYNWNSKVVMLHGLKSDSGKFSSYKGAYVGKKHMWFRKHVRSIACMFVLAGFFFLLDSLMVSIFDSINLQTSSTSKISRLKVGLWYDCTVSTCVFCYLA